MKSKRIVKVLINCLLMVAICILVCNTVYAESSKTIQQTINPLCPVCGIGAWITTYQTGPWKSNAARMCGHGYAYGYDETFWAYRETYKKCTHCGHYELQTREVIISPEVCHGFDSWDK